MSKKIKKVKYFIRSQIEFDTIKEGEEYITYWGYDKEAYFLSYISK